MDLHVFESDLHVFENLHSMQLTIEVVRCWFDMICEEGFFRLTQVSAVTNDQEVGSYQQARSNLYTCCTVPWCDYLWYSCIGYS